jgi:hypothetical protein
MRIVPGAAAIGVSAGSAVAQTAAVVFWWVVAGPWYFAVNYYVIGPEIPIGMLALANLLVAGLIGFIPAIIFVPLTNRWAAL